MVSPRLKRQKRQAGNALVAWLKAHGIEPTEPCKGKTALQVLVENLIKAFGQVPTALGPAGDLCELGSGKVLVHRDDARSFLWGEEVTVTESVEEPEEDMDVEEEEEIAEAIKPVKRSPPKKKKKSTSSKDKKK
jgi:hypothetical protein